MDDWRWCLTTSPRVNRPLSEEKFQWTKSGNGLMKVEQVPLNGEFFSVSKYVRQKASIATVFFLRNKN